VYVWTAPGPDTKGGLAPHLASGGSGRYHHWIKGAGEWQFIPRLGADLVVAMAPVNGRISSQQPVLLVAAGSADHAEPQASDRTSVSAEATVTHWSGPVITRLVFTGTPEKAARGRIPGLRGQAKIICRTNQ